jgi:predicted hydrocarbon binding protein
MEDKVDWIRGIKFSPGKGEITLSGERHVLVNAYAFRAYRDAISEIIGHGSDAVLYLAGKRHSEKFISLALKKNALTRLARRLKWGRNAITHRILDVLVQYGFGTASFEKLDLDKESIIILHNSCIAKNYDKKQKRPVCSYIAGLLAGGGQAIAKRPYECVETHCIAKGDKYCRFMAKPD